MNRKNLTAAVLAGLAGAAGIASTAQAVNLNPDGLGQVLIYPYYTVNGDNATIMSVVNTTGEAKAVKVRFLEGLNSQEVLDFNLYLSAYDVWTAEIKDITWPDGQVGGSLKTTDNSCTVPAIKGNAELTDDTVPFFNYKYAGVGGDKGPSGYARTREGYFEIIEMGVLTNDEEDSADAATHDSTGVPDDCDQLVDAWALGVNNVPGYWLADSTVDMDPPSGGLFGSAAVVNVGGGIMFSYDAKALEGWSEFVFHTEPGSILPSLNSGSETMAYVYYNGGVYSDDFEDAVDAVSAVFMHDTIMNEYNTLSAYGGRSEWVMTFPTKRFYTQGSAKAPFTDYFRDHADPDTIADGACEIIKFGPGEKGIWDREEQTTPDIIIPGSGPGFSPPPPGEEPPEDPVAVACSEVTVVRFGDSSDFSGSTELFGAETNVLLVDNEGTWGFNEGWLQLNLLDADNPNTDTDEGERWLPNEAGEDSFGGLPVVGFWAFAVKNENVTEGVLANYSGLFGHKSTRLVSTAALPDPQ